jgi:hypothetical protein
MRGAVTLRADRFTTGSTEQNACAGRGAGSTEFWRRELSVSEHRDIIAGLVSELTEDATFCEVHGNTDEADRARRQSDLIQGYRPGVGVTATTVCGFGRLR